MLVDGVGGDLVASSEVCGLAAVNGLLGVEEGIVEKGLEETELETGVENGFAEVGFEDGFTPNNKFPN